MAEQRNETHFCYTEVNKVAQVADVIEFKQHQYDTEEYLRLARLVQTLDTPVVITRGTNDIAELAFFLDVTLNRKCQSS